MAVSSEALSQQINEVVKVIEEQVDSKIQELENLEEDDLEKLRRQRLDQMKKAQKQKQTWLANGHGCLTELANEKEFFEASKKSGRFVCHFYEASNNDQCRVLDQRLQELARKHIEARVVKIDGLRAKFLVDRLNIQFYPTIALIKDGETLGYLRGKPNVDESGNVVGPPKGEDAPTVAGLEWKLSELGLITKTDDIINPNQSKKNAINVLTKRSIREDRDQNSDDDWE